MSDRLLDHLGPAVLAAYAIGVAATSDTDDREGIRALALKTLAQCLRPVDDILGYVSPARALPPAEVLAPIATRMVAEQPVAEVQEEPAPRTRRRRRTPAKIDSDNAAAAAVRGTGEGLRASGRMVPEAVAQAPTRRAPTPAVDGPRRPGRPRRIREEVIEEPETAATGAIEEFEESGADTGDSSGKVNLNTATRGQLMRLPRIGALAADKIIAYRDELGPIRNLRQLRQNDVLTVSGAKNIRDLVVF